MPPKKATTTKKAGTPAAHPPYADMIKEAVINLKEKGGSSRQSIKKYVQANYNLAGVTEAAFNTNINKALQKGSDSGAFVRPKGPSGPVKLGAPSKAADSKTAVKKTTKAKAPKTAAAKKTTTVKKATTATKKAPAAKKASATKTKSKANTSKVRKTPAMAPAVEDKKPVALTKTKSGRVQKSTAPQPDKKPAAKKATTKAPKKAAVAKKA